MKFTRLCLKFAVAAIVIFLTGLPAQACPTCFSSATKEVLQSYYFSAAFLSLLPFGLVLFVVVWFRKQK